MNRKKKDLAQNFNCPKCHARGGIGEEVTLPSLSLRIPPVAATQYFAVSCGLCGYTEFYNLALAIPAREEVPRQADLVRGTEKA
ncbi:hypothetical protein HYR69_08155 [Candidatus Sumerlaeota bacterium]|nr:hypothetical protein [Candidatus Sumerlaeota bacterium]